MLVPEPLPEQTAGINKTVINSLLVHDGDDEDGTGAGTSKRSGGGDPPARRRKSSAGGAGPRAHEPWCVRSQRVPACAASVPQSPMELEQTRADQTTIRLD